MTRSNLRSFLRLRIPEIKSTSVISDADLNTLMNLAAKAFIRETDALPTSSTFTTSADQATYNLSTVISTFGKIRKEGVWFYNSQTTKWNQLDATTIDFLNQNFQSWKNMDSGLPLRYVYEGDVITLNPKPSSTYAGSNNLEIYYYSRSVDMSDDSHYPYSGSTTEYPHLANYDEFLADYIRYEIKQMAGKMKDAEEAKALFMVNASRVKQELQYRPDLIHEMRTTRAGNVLHHQSGFKN